MRGILSASKTAGFVALLSLALWTGAGGSAECRRWGPDKAKPLGCLTNRAELPITSTLTRFPGPAAAPRAKPLMLRYRHRLPRRGAANQPSATPWEQDEYQLEHLGRALKGRKSLCRRASTAWITASRSPITCGALSGHDRFGKSPSTHGVAMGWLVRPLRGRIENAQHQKAPARLAANQSRHCAAPSLARRVNMLGDTGCWSHNPPL